MGMTTATSSSLEYHLNRVFGDDIVLSVPTDGDRWVLVIDHRGARHAWIIEESRAEALTTRLSAVPDDWREPPHDRRSLPWDALDEESFDHTAP